MGLMHKLGSVAYTVANKTAKSGMALGTQVYRKVRKPFRQYMAPERAEKVIESQEKIPRRAPLNLPKIDFSKEHIKERKDLVKEMLKKSDELLSHLKHVKVVSHDSPAAASKADDNKPPLPQRLYETRAQVTDTPRGLIQLQDVVNLLHNHSLEPEEWTPDAISERFKLRNGEVQDLVKHFRLLKPEEQERQTPFLETTQ